MVAGSILPVTIHNDKLYFLFGKENPSEKSAKGWSDFGGRLENNETPFEGAIREGSEELSGFLGNKSQLKSLIRKNGGIYKLKYNNYHLHLFFIEYDENLPKYFNQNHYFLWDNMDHDVLNKSKLFEKIEIKWFSIADMKKHRKSFRNFYQYITDLLFENRENIETFAKTKFIK
jgi:8-oxo-dGTP pyrophosphatase MutT (NUDIX family)